MKLKILGLDGTQKGDISVPESYTRENRPDVIKRAVHAIEANNRQRYGAKEDAGMRASADLSRRRHDYRGGYGAGISRVPRKILSRRGTRMNWVAAVAPGTVGGRRAHPPKAEKVFKKSINAKENRLAIRSALSASFDKEQVTKRGHHVPDAYPFVVDSSVESVGKTKELVMALEKLGLQDELARGSIRKVRAGKGTSRGRRYAGKRSVLFVTANAGPLTKSAVNVPGVEIAPVTHLNAALLAPGGEQGRAVIFSQAALEKLIADKLYTEDRVAVAAEAKTEAKKPAASKETKEAKEKKAAAKPAAKAAPASA